MKNGADKMEIGRRCPTNGVLCSVIWVLVTWIAVSQVFGPGRLNLPNREETFVTVPDRIFESQKWRIEAGGGREYGNCDTRDAHYLEATAVDTSPDNAWNQMKWIGQPALCPVRGELIERLDSVNNFRRGFALRFSGNVEDRIHILPWLLGSRVDLNRRKRRVYLDLGSNSFKSSLRWFMRMYPCDFTEIHAFEVKKDLLQIPKPFDEKNNRAGANRGSRRTKQTPGIPGWMLKRIKVHNNMVADVDDPETASVNITRFIKDELKLKAEDAVIVKLDIDGGEWPILVRWLNDPEMAQIIDEIFVEIHYNHESMYNFNWYRFSHARTEAKRLLADLRWKGFYAHFWP